jgi:gamma-glutamylcysteine synthetase
MGHALGVIARLVRMGWKPSYDDIHAHLLIGATHPELGTVTTDAGMGTLEWISPPSSSMLDVARWREQTLDLLVICAREIGEVILGVGRQPLTRGTRDHWVPKGRYEYLVTRFGERIHHIPETASQQVHLGCRGTDDTVELLDDFLALSGVLTALAANASVFHGAMHPNALASRQRIWQEFAPERVGVPAQPFRTLARLTGWMCASEYLFRKEEVGGITSYTLEGQPFATCESVLSANGAFGGHARCHEACLWQDARARYVFGTVEVRSCCQQPQSAGLALPALCLGLAENRTDRRALIDEHPWSAWQASRNAAADHGIMASVGAIPIHAILLDALAIAESGLRSRGLGEEILLEPLRDRLDRGEPPAWDQIQAVLEGGIPRLLRRFAYRER